MKSLGISLLVIGIILGLYALNMDTSVAVDYGKLSDSLKESGIEMPERVNNWGLMDERRNYLIFAGILSVAGLVLIVVPVKTGRVNADNWPRQQGLESKAMPAIIRQENDGQIPAEWMQSAKMREARKPENRSDTDNNILGNKGREPEHVSNAGELLKWHELREKGVITEQEFNEQKNRLLG